MTDALEVALRSFKELRDSDDDGNDDGEMDDTSETERDESDDDGGSGFLLLFVFSQWLPLLHQYLLSPYSLNILWAASPPLKQYRWKKRRN